MRSLAIEKIHPNDWNPNVMTADEFAELVAEIDHLGKPAKPIVLRPNKQDYEIVDGEHTYQALLELGHNDLRDGWYEIEPLDDFEAMRQTYKRNQHGTHNPTKQGLLFRRMMDERELSRRALAEEIGVSEGTIRNSLEYAKAVEVRNDYAFDALSVKQIRAYNRLPCEVGDLWLACGANLKALYLNSKFIKETKLHEYDRAVHYDEYYFGEETEDAKHATIAALGPLLNLLPLLCYIRTPEGFTQAIERLMAMDHARWVYGIGQVRGPISREDAAPYLAVLAGIRWNKTEHYEWAAKEILRGLFRVENRKLIPIVPADAFMAWVQGSEWSTLDELKMGIEVLTAKHRPELRKQDVRTELMEIELAEAPEYIRELTGLDTKTRYQMWVAADSYIRDGCNPDLIAQVVGDAVDEMVADKRRLQKIEELKEVDYSLYVKAYMQAEPALRPAKALEFAYNEAARVKRCHIYDDFFSDKQKMIDEVISQASGCIIIREGQIESRKATDVLAARLAMLEMPELRLLAAMVIQPDGYSDGFTLWFTEMRRKTEYR